MFIRPESARMRKRKKNGLMAAMESSKHTMMTPRPRFGLKRALIDTLGGGEPASASCFRKNDATTNAIRARIARASARADDPARKPGSIDEPEAKSGTSMMKRIMGPRIDPRIGGPASEDTSEMGLDAFPWPGFRRGEIFECDSSPISETTRADTTERIVDPAASNNVEIPERRYGKIPARSRLNP